jgi:hypothetical protein
MNNISAPLDNDEPGKERMLNGQTSTFEKRHSRIAFPLPTLEFFKISHKLAI